MTVASRGGRKDIGRQPKINSENNILVIGKTWAGPRGARLAGGIDHGLKAKDEPGNACGPEKKTDLIGG
jgi:hypothetical protein